MEHGYVKLWRKCLDSGLLQNGPAWQLFGYLLLKTTHRPHRQIIGGMVFELEPGEVIFGRAKAASDLGLSEKQVRTAFELLKKLEIVASRSTNRCTVVSFVNWHRYQDEGPAGGQQEGQPQGQQEASRGPAEGQQRATNKNERTKNKEEEKKVSKARAREKDDRTESRASYDSMVAEYASSPGLRSALGDFIVMRQRIRAPVTNAALKQTFRELDKMAGDNESLKAAIVEQSVQRAWRGVFPLRENPKIQSDPWAGAI